MLIEQCFAGLCFAPLDPAAQKIFGFSEFLAGLALMILAWTIADVRYRFRVRTAPIPLQGLTFGVVVVVGTLALLTDLWRAEGWMVPRGNLLSPASWQAILAGLFLLTFLTWTWFAFIRPPMYGKRNAKRFAQTLYRFVLKGSPSDLAVVADELAYSAKPLIRHATNIDRFERFRRGKGEDDQRPDPPTVEAFANDILLLIADKRLCRAIVESSPATALAFFQEVGKAKKYGVQIGTFGKNIVNEALINKESFLYHEAEGYESGLIGYIKPLSQAMFSNHEMVEAVDTLLDPDIMGKSKWDADQWEAYCRIVLMTFRDYVENGYGNHSFTLYRAKGYIEHAAMDLYKLNGVASSAWDDDLQARLRVIVEFIKDAVELLDKKEVPDYVQMEKRKRDRNSVGTFYDHLAGMIFELFFAASTVRSPVDLCWWIQHNSVWGKLFNFHNLDGKAAAVVKFKVRRLLYKEIADMTRFPNFKGARILGFCLNVMGIRPGDRRYNKDSHALHKAVLAWTKKNYAWLHGYHPQVAEACLVDGITYDAENLRIVKTYPADGLRREPAYVYLNVDPAEPGRGPDDD